MKFLLILQGDDDPALRRDDFERAAHDAGELVGGELLAHPQLAVHVPDPASEHSAITPIDGFYLIDVESADRAVELARLLPDARASGRSVEVRAVMNSTATDL
ncbi:YciI family protein [Kribbella sp. NPDC055071]